MKVTIEFDLGEDEDKGRLLAALGLTVVAQPEPEPSALADASAQVSAEQDKAADEESTPTTLEEAAEAMAPDELPPLEFEDLKAMKVAELRDCMVAELGYDSDDVKGVKKDELLQMIIDDSE